MTFAEYIRFLFSNCEKYEALMLNFSAKHREYARKANKIDRPYKQHNDWLKRETYLTEVRIYEIRFNDARERLHWTIGIIGSAAKKHYTRAFESAKAEHGSVPRDFHYVFTKLLKEQTLLQKEYDVWVKKSGKMMSDYYRELK
jgi:hypothetical protein